MYVCLLCTYNAYICLYACLSVCLLVSQCFLFGVESFPFSLHGLLLVVRLHYYSVHRTKFLLASPRLFMSVGSTFTSCSLVSFHLNMVKECIGSSNTFTHLKMISSNFYYFYYFCACALCVCVHTCLTHVCAMFACHRSVLVPCPVSR